MTEDPLAGRGAEPDRSAEELEAEQLLERVSAALADRYEIRSTIGSGGMATVYLAVARRERRPVAIKVLRPEAAGLIGTERFLREVQIGGSLRHPNILPLYDSGEADGLPYLVMPYIEGGSLKDRLGREKQLPIEEALRITREVASALDGAHERGVVHRDIKPANIMMDGDRPLVSDFGIARALSDVGEDKLTVSGATVGTPGYMSPEQATAMPDVDRRADIYSLACVLHEMLAGEPLFTGPSQRAVIAKHVAVPATPIRALRSRVPEGVERALLRALEKTPVDRFPSAGEFVAAMEAGAISETRPPNRRASLRRAAADHPIAAALFAGILLAAGALGAIRLMRPGPAWTDRPSSVVALPFRAPGSTEAEDAFAVELADRTTDELGNWDALRVVSSVDLAGPRLDLGMSGPLLDRTDAGIALAKEVGAQAMLALTVDIRGDSASVSGQLFDSRSGRPVGEPVRSSAAIGSPFEAVAPVVAAVLGFGGAPGPERAFGAGTRDPEAAADYLLGLQELGRNRMSEAEGFFRSAVQRDSAFAAALSYLGQSLYWRSQENPGGLARLGPEVSRWSTEATRHLEGLATLRSAHVRGFFAFQGGDYAEARSVYDSIIAADPSDAYAHVMLGEIELQDRWLDGSIAEDPFPRSTLNRAREEFSRTVGIEPTFELAYGRMFEIQRAVEDPLIEQSCPSFQEPGDEFRPVWQTGAPSDRTLSFCPVALDSIVWIPKTTFDTADRTMFRAGADRLFRQAVSELQRWASFAPDQPRPLEDLADAFLVQRARARALAPDRLRGLAAEALRYRSEALALRSDTLPGDLVDLANLHLAAGQLDSAVDFARRALAEYAATSADSIRGPHRLINVLMATGQTAIALQLAAAYTGQQGVEDPDTGGMIALEGAEPIIERIKVLGALGIGGTPLRAELNRLRDTWGGAGYSARQQEVLRNEATLRIAASLTLDSLAASAWKGWVSVEHPLWLALIESFVAPADAQEHYARALEVETPGLDAARPFILGTVAARLGRPREAIARFSTLDSIPYRVDAFDIGWGLEVLSHLLRGEQYEQLGDRAAALEHFSRFIEARSETDSLSLPRVEEARRGADRVSGGGV